MPASTGRVFLDRIGSAIGIAPGPKVARLVLLLISLAPVRSFEHGKPTSDALEPPFRVAIAGLVHGHVFGFFQQYLHSPMIQIVGVAEPDQAFAARVAAQYHLDQSLLYTDVEEMLSKTHPQAVLIYTNTFDHRKVVEICARHKIDVMMEKPLAVSLADARAIENAARDSHIHVMVNYETTWYPGNRKAYELLHQGAIDDLRKFVARDGHRGPKEIGVEPEFLFWLTDPKLNGAGALFDFGCYGADLVTWLLDNQRPLAVTAVTQQVKPEIYPRVDDEATIVLTYPKAQAILQASWNWAFDVKDIQVYGRTGSVKTVRRDHVLIRREGEREEQDAAAPPIPSPDDDPISYLRSVVLDGRVPRGPSSLETNIIVMEILDAARESASAGKTIRLVSDR